jgi:hypothetical protein
VEALLPALAELLGDRRVDNDDDDAVDDGEARANALCAPLLFVPGCAHVDSPGGEESSDADESKDADDSGEERADQEDAEDTRPLVVLGAPKEESESRSCCFSCASS